MQEEIVGLFILRFTDKFPPSIAQRSMCLFISNLKWHLFLSSETLFSKIYILFCRILAHDRHFIFNEHFKMTVMLVFNGIELKVV